jgi:hypothetical protein
MITVFVTILDRIELLSYFLDYYSKLGAHRFVIIVSGGINNPIWEKVVATKGRNSVVLEGCAGDPHGDAENDSLNEVRQLFQDGWHVVCDLDEFHSFGESSLPVMVETLERTGMNATKHLFADRLAKDLSFPPIAGRLDDAFPLKSNLSEIMGCLTSKIGLIRHDISTTVGHHTAPCQTLYNGFETHHFKWSMGVVERIKERIKLFDRIGVGYVSESKKFLTFIKDGKIDPETPGLKIEPAEKLGI